MITTTLPFISIILSSILTICPVLVYADNVLGVSQDKIQLLPELKSNSIVIFNCPECQGTKVFKINSSKVEKLGNSDLYGIRARYDLIIQSTRPLKSLDQLECADRKKLEKEQEDVYEGVIDLGYSYFAESLTSRFISVGSLVRVKNIPVSEVNISEPAIKNIQRCLTALESEVTKPKK